MAPPPRPRGLANPMNEALSGDARAMLRAIRDRVDHRTGAVSGTLTALARLADMDRDRALRALQVLHGRGLVRWTRAAAGE
jgi:hypothetical protein